MPKPSDNLTTTKRFVIYGKFKHAAAKWKFVLEYDDEERAKEELEMLSESSTVRFYQLTRILQHKDELDDEVPWTI